MDFAQLLGTPVRPVLNDAPRTFHLPDWGRISDQQRIAILRKLVLTSGRDPRIATLAVKIVRDAGAQPREYEKQAAALLAWVQQNIYYVNEPGERLQTPDYTLNVRYGDCDDMAIFLAALCETLKLPWRFVISGLNKHTKAKVRWIEGTPPVRDALWTHIYLMIGSPPFRPTRWKFAEPTLKGAKLGWDVIQAAAGEMPLPEMAGLGSFGNEPPRFPPPRMGPLPIHPPPFINTVSQPAPPPQVRADLRDPAFNMREVCKELLLLEDHLAIPDRRCGDCIRKHTLKSEALVDEAITLDVGGRWKSVLVPLRADIRALTRHVAEGRSVDHLLQHAREIRKRLSPVVFGAHAPGPRPVGPPPGPVPFSVLRPIGLAGWAGWGAASAAGAGGQTTTAVATAQPGDPIESPVNWKQLGMAVGAGVAVSFLSHVVITAWNRNHGRCRTED